MEITTRHKHKHKHKKNGTVGFSCAYAYVQRVTCEKSTRQVSGFVLLMFLLMIMFMSQLFSLMRQPFFVTKFSQLFGDQMASNQKQNSGTYLFCMS